MNYIDAALCIPLLWGLYKGFVKGLIVEAASFVAFGLAVYGSLHFSELLATKIKELLDWDSPYLHIIAFALTFLGIAISVYFLAKLIQRLAEGMALGGINKIGGAVFGGLKIALVLSILIFIIDAVESSYSLFTFEAKNESILYKPVGMVAPMLIPGLKNSTLIDVFPTSEDLEVNINFDPENQSEKSLK